MKPFALGAGRLLPWAAGIFTLISTSTIRASTDPTLAVNLARVGQNLILSWNGVLGATYQV
jgi:hypothetical protein